MGALYAQTQVTKYMAMHRFEGPASIFLSMAPDDVHNLLCIMLAHPYAGPTRFPSGNCDDIKEKIERGLQRHETVTLADGQTVVLSENALQRLASNNPVATTAVFKHLLDNVHANLIGMPAARLTNEPLEARSSIGLWGMNTCHRDVVECNDRASQHIHGMLHGGLSPALVADVAAEEGVVLEVSKELLPDVSLDSAFEELGLTSTKAGELCNRLVSRLGGRCKLPVELAAELPKYTPRRLEKYLLDITGQGARRSNPREDPASGPAVIPPVVGLRATAMAALDTQVQGALPLAYHAIYVAQRTLHVSARRDVAHPVPTPPPRPEVWKGPNDSADEYSEYLVKRWAPAFHKHHPAAEVFARIANGCTRPRGRTELRQLTYEDCRDQIWWPTFEHHARIVILNRHSHEHCKSCVKTERGKVGCRFCATWPHGIKCTRCVQLEVNKYENEVGGCDSVERHDDDTEMCDAPTGERRSGQHHVVAQCESCDDCASDVPAELGSHSCRCVVCFAGGALHKACTFPKNGDRAAAIAKEQRSRDLYYRAIDPVAEETSSEVEDTEDVEGTDQRSEVDSRILAVEIARPHIPAAEEQTCCPDCKRLVALCTCVERAGGAAGVARLPALIADMEQFFCGGGGEQVGDAEAVEGYSELACGVSCVCAHTYGVEGDVTGGTVNVLAELVVEATAKRRPYPFVEQAVLDSCKLDPLEHPDVVAEARATLRCLVAPDQPLGKVLRSGDFCELRNRIRVLAMEPLPAPTDAEKVADYKLGEKRRAKEMLLLLEQWTWSSTGEKMACRNGLIADFNLVNAGCVRGNSVPYSLGAGAGSKSGAMYQIKCALAQNHAEFLLLSQTANMSPRLCRYMGKESVQISAAATLLADAAQHVHDFPSSADDVGQPERNARHYMQHVLNASNMELEATQAAALVLNMSSSTGSHRNEYHGAWDVQHLAEEACNNESGTEGLLTLGAEEAGGSVDAEDMAVDECGAAEDHGLGGDDGGSVDAEDMPVDE